MADPIKLGENGNSSDSPLKINLGAPSNPAPAPASTTPPTGGNGGMGNIFTQSQAKKEDSKMITSIISQKDVAQKTKSILGPAPTLEKSIEKEKEAAQKGKLRLVQFVFVMLFIASGAMAFYFYSELSPDFSFFGPNTTQRLTDTNTNLRQVQTLVNKDRYLAAQLKLNEFSYQSDRFLSSVAKMSDTTINSIDKRAISVDLDESKKALPVLLGEVRDLLSKDIVAQTTRSESEPEQTPELLLQTAQQDLRNALSSEKKKYGQNPTNAQDILDVKLIDNSVKLAGNTQLLNALQATSTDAFQKQLDDYSAAPDPQKLKGLQTVIGKVLSSTKSDLATISDIKRNRVEWSSVIGQINEQTSMVQGSNFTAPELYDLQGGIRYNGYEFDSNNNKLVLSGTTKTFDGSNFTLMSKLIDQLESSQYFQDVEMRSFAKSKSGTGVNEGYTANFKIDLRLETAGFSDKNQPVSLQGDTLKGAAATGAKRTTSTSSAPVSTQQQTFVPPSITAPAGAAAPSSSVSPTQQNSDSAQPTSTTTGTAPASASAPAVILTTPGTQQPSATQVTTGA